MNEYSTIHRYALEIDQNFSRYLSILPLSVFFYLSHTIIQSITSSEMCSLYLTHPSAHTLGAVGTVHSAVEAQEAPARPPHVTLYKIHLFETR